MYLLFCILFLRNSQIIYASSTTKSECIPVWHRVSKLQTRHLSLSSQPTLLTAQSWKLVFPSLPHVPLVAIVQPDWWECCSLHHSNSSPSCCLSFKHNLFFKVTLSSMPWSWQVSIMRGWGSVCVWGGGWASVEFSQFSNSF